MDWVKVRFADECEPCEMCGEPWCKDCDMHYSDCDCLGPTEEAEYEWRGEELWGRRLNETL